MLRTAGSRSEPVRALSCRNVQNIAPVADLADNVLIVADAPRWMMTHTQKVETFDALAIQRAHDRLGHRHGWRFLCSPIATLTEAAVAFIGINPGGAADQSTHGRYSVEGGSAFVDEVWPEDSDRAPGTSPLQVQVRALFAMLGVEPTAVLAGNLIPFRSSREGTLHASAASTHFGIELWRAVFAEHRPPLVITHGRTPSVAVAELLGADAPETIATGWGNTKGTRWRFSGGHLVCLPHLSTFKLLSRDECREPLRELLGVAEIGNN